MIKNILLGCLCVSLLSGCYSINTSQAPVATTYAMSKQQKMQAAHHWDVLASHEAKLISSSISSHSTAVYIEGSDNKNATIFDRGFKSLLTSQLVSLGADVRTSASGAAVVSYGVEVVEHKDRGFIRPTQGHWTLLTAGVAVIAYAADKWDPSAKAVALVPLAADLFGGESVDESNFEIIVTTKVIGRDQILHSSSNIYYINGGDADHYAPNTKVISVVGE